MRYFNLYKILCAIGLIFLLARVLIKRAILFYLQYWKATQTGLNFTNNLKPTPEFNMFKYMYFYNGAGVGAGDFNNDGLIDLFFSSNQGDNKLYLNKGTCNLKM